jgi:ABC-type nitrate/sulfonate/bicarbonate transport system substrate-binding protein
MKRAVRSLASFIVFVGIFFVRGESNGKIITVAYPSPSWNTSLPVSTAKEFGIFAAEGLEVRPVYVRGGPVVMAALLSGEADYAVIAGVTAVSSISQRSRSRHCCRPYRLHRSGFGWRKNVH